MLRGSTQRFIPDPEWVTKMQPWSVCAKCGSGSVKHRQIEEFVLRHDCQTCGHDWETATLDARKAAETIDSPPRLDIEE